MYQAKRQRRHERIRSRISGTADRPRASVYRSNRRIVVQLIDDEAQRTLAAASGQVKDVADKIITLAKKQHINQIVFDRGGYQYHGKIKSVAEALREGGLKF